MRALTAKPRIEIIMFAPQMPKDGPKRSTHGIATGILILDEKYSWKMKTTLLEFFIALLDFSSNRISDCG